MPELSVKRVDMVSFVKESNSIENVWLGPGHPAFDNHIEVLDQVLKSAHRKDSFLSEKELLAWHNKLMGWYLTAQVGVYRSDLVRVGRWVAPLPGFLPRLMAKCLEKANNATSVEDCWNVHHFFETVHPFVDGNGRMGRLLLNWCLIRNKLPFHVIKEKDRMSYYESINEWKSAKWNPGDGGFWTS